MFRGVFTLLMWYYEWTTLYILARCSAAVSKKQRSTYKGRHGERKERERERERKLVRNDISGINGFTVNDTSWTFNEWCISIVLSTGRLETKRLIEKVTTWATMGWQWLKIRARVTCNSLDYFAAVKLHYWEERYEMDGGHDIAAVVKIQRGKHSVWNDKRAYV